MTKNSLRVALSVLCFLLAFSSYAGLRAKAGDVTGAWTFVLQTEGGERRSNATLKVDGKDVSGTWAEKSKVAGTFADDTLDLSFPFESDEVGPGTLVIKGKLANDEINGNWSFREYSGTFKATRAAAPAN